MRPDDLLSRYGNDQTRRYFFLREMTFGHDARFSDEGSSTASIMTWPVILASDQPHAEHGHKYFEGKVPARSGDDAGLPEMRAALAAACDDYLKAVECVMRFSQGLEKLWEFVRSLTAISIRNNPWALAKKGETERLASVCVIAGSHACGDLPARSGAH